MQTSDIRGKAFVAPTILSGEAVTQAPASVPRPATASAISNWNGEVVSKPRAVYTPTRDAEIMQ
ncbi:MAG TPA: hypothetical protein VLC93_12900, partial [Myxococcota bacterium]|nr:hypothetical protein [Myxococcota bacterium]